MPLRYHPVSFLFHCSARVCPMDQSSAMLRAARSLVNLERGRSGKMDNAAPLVKRRNLLDNHFIKIIMSTFTINTSHSFQLDLWLQKDSHVWIIGARVYCCVDRCSVNWRYCIIITQSESLEIVQCMTLMPRAVCCHLGQTAGGAQRQACTETCMWEVYMPWSIHGNHTLHGKRQAMLV